MKFVTFESESGQKLGALLGDRVLDLTAAAALAGHSGFPETMQSLIEAGEAGLVAARALVSQAPSAALLSRQPLLAPLPHPIRFRDCSLFLEHMVVAMERVAQEMAAKTADPAVALAEFQANGKYSMSPEFYKQVIYYNADHLLQCGSSPCVWHR